MLCWQEEVKQQEVSVSHSRNPGLVKETTTQPSRAVHHASTTPTGFLVWDAFRSTGKAAGEILQLWFASKVKLWKHTMHGGIVV